MTELTPTTAYSLLDEHERICCDDYVQWCIGEQHRLRERIVHALYKPIMPPHVHRSKGALNRPLVRAAVAERLRDAAAQQDISPDRTINELSLLAHTSMDDVTEPDGFGGIRPKDPRLINPEHMKAVKTLKVSYGTHGPKYELVMHDKIQAIKMLAELQGLVAPDRPAPLREYIAPPEAATQQRLEAPEAAYQALLDNLSPVRT